MTNEGENYGRKECYVGREMAMLKINNRMKRIKHKDEI